MVKFRVMKEAEREWLKGMATLGAATKWTADEIRLVTELGYGLAEQGRVGEAIVLFEGLAALAPATVYFQAALGALWLRENEFDKALRCLNQVLQSDAKNIVALVNRGEALMRLNERAAASRDLSKAVQIAKETKRARDETSLEGKSAIRARALLLALEKEFA